jgi:transmembrane sensor
MIPEEYESIIIRVLSGASTPEEKALLDKWMVESDQNRKLFNDYARIYNLQDDSSLPAFNSEGEWIRLEKTIANTPKQMPVLTITRVLYRAAAAVLLVMASLFIIREMMREREIVHDATDRWQTVRLHDGTNVILKENSVLRHSSDFNDDDRIVQLEGDAFFEVVPNSEKPFTVLSDESLVQVLGTSFMVFADPKSKTSRVEVREGVVKFSARSDQANFVKLSAGQKGVLDKSTHRITTKSVSTENILAWKDRTLVFRKASLDEVVEAVESYFNIEIEVLNNELLPCRFTSSFEDPQVAEVIEALSVSLNMDVLMKDGKYTFGGEGCQ